jgi:hypothetical protein
MLRLVLEPPAELGRAPLGRAENFARGFGTKKSEVQMAGKPPIALILIADKASVAVSAE